MAAMQGFGWTIRPVVAEDLPALEQVIAATGLFPADILAGMMAPYLAGAAEEIWLAAVPGPAAVAYCAPERMTEGSWNLLLIAVHPASQRKGCAAALVAAVEARLAAGGARLLLVETSGLPEFEDTRAFYRRLGFAEEARIRDYYRDGDDKLVFRKSLTPPG